MLPTVPTMPTLRHINHPLSLVYGLPAWKVQTYVVDLLTLVLRLPAHIVCKAIEDLGVVRTLATVAVRRVLAAHDFVIASRWEGQ